MLDGLGDARTTLPAALVCRGIVRGRVDWSGSSYLNQ
jgi:hypothetical protein